MRWCASSSAPTTSLFDGDFAMPQLMMHQWAEWHTRGNVLVAGTGTGTVYMWDVPGANMSYFGGHSVCRRTCAIDLTCRRLRRRRARGHRMVSEWGCCIGVTQAGKSFVTASEDGSVIVWSPKTQEAQLRFDGPPHTPQYHAYLTRRRQEQRPVPPCRGDGAGGERGWEPGGDGRRGRVGAAGASALGQGMCVRDTTARHAQQVIAALQSHADSVEAAAFSASSCADLRCWLGTHRAGRPKQLATAALDGALNIYDQTTNMLQWTCAHQAGARRAGAGVIAQ